MDVVGCLGVECRELGELSCGFLVGIVDNPYAKSARNVLAFKVVNASMAYMANISIPYTDEVFKMVVRARKS